MSPAPKRMVHEYSDLTGLIIREETEADRAICAEAKAAVERYLSEPSRGWSMPVCKHVYQAFKRLEARRTPPRPGDLVAVDVAWGPYRTRSRR